MEAHQADVVAVAAVDAVVLPVAEDEVSFKSWILRRML